MQGSSDRLRLICIHLPTRGEDDDYWIIGLVRSRWGCTRDRFLGVAARERERTIVEDEQKQREREREREKEREKERARHESRTKSKERNGGREREILSKFQLKFSSLKTVDTGG